MAYSASNPPALVWNPLSSSAAIPRIWTYSSVDPTTAVTASGYFSNGAALGMKVDDWMFITMASTTRFAIGKVTTVNASSAATVVAGSMTST